jgi:CheY-like chemotaxis protein
MNTDDIRPNPRVLIVDDNIGMLETLTDIAQASGFDIDTTTDGAGTDRLMNAHHYDVAVFDIVLPDTTGVELARRARARYPDTKIVIITAYTNSELIDEARAENITEVLFKPIEPARLLEVLRRLTT